MSTPNFHRSIEGVPRRVPLTIPATFGLIATLDKQLRVASPDIQPGLEMSRQGGIETEGVLKLEENTSYKIDYTPTLGV